MRIFVLEDEALLAMHVQHELETAGYDVLGPAGSISEALILLDAGSIDLAILDANIDGEAPAGLAREISDRDIPFLYLSAYDHRFIEANLPRAPILSKPLEMAALNRLIEQLTSQPA